MMSSVSSGSLSALQSTIAPPLPAPLPLLPLLLPPLPPPDDELDPPEPVLLFDPEPDALLPPEPLLPLLLPVLLAFPPEPPLTPFWPVLELDLSLRSSGSFAQPAIAIANPQTAAQHNVAVLISVSPACASRIARLPHGPRCRGGVAGEVPPGSRDVRWLAVFFCA